MSVLFGGVRVFPQGYGPDIQLIVFGDEFYARYETTRGYTVVYDPDIEQYCYAIMAKGCFASSGTSTYKPVPPGIKKHLQESNEVRRNKFSRRYDIMRPTASPPTGVMATLGRNNGLLTGRQLNKGKVQGLTILIEFQDEKTSITNAEVEALLNGDNYREHGNYCSVKEYYLLMSSEKLEYTNKVVGPLTLNKKRGYYIKHSLMPEALNMIYNNRLELGVDLSDFDSKGDGIIDAINFLYAGTTVWEDWLWPHNSHVDLVFGGMRTDLYTIQSLGRSPVDLKIGTMCHESGHLLCRFPDLYDYGKRDNNSDPSRGLGVYCLMSAGNHLNRGRTPAPLCSYLRDLAGWTDKEIILNETGEYEAMQGDYSTVMRHVTDEPNEYFLVENRGDTGLDAYCPSRGLAVYHCDTLGSNEWEDGTGREHYQCALVQADGRKDLENNHNDGDPGDLFGLMAGLALSSSTIPSSKAWGGVESGLNILDISGPGEAITFKTGLPELVLPVLVMEDTPNILIPDNDTEGVTRSLDVMREGIIEDIEISVDISHTYIEDLEVGIITPYKETITLQRKEGGDQDDLVAVFNGDTSPALAGYKGRSMRGGWSLYVKDLAARDIGRLNYWKITIAYSQGGNIVRAEAAPALDIPDNQSEGIRSAIVISENKSASEMRISVEISHTYMGDLQIDLIAPWGQSLTLFQFLEGSNKKNLKKIFESSLLPSLAGLISGERKIEGEWVLHVMDLAERDTGRLERWSLEFTA